MGEVEAPSRMARERSRKVGAKLGMGPMWQAVGLALGLTEVPMREQGQEQGQGQAHWGR